MPDTRKHRGQHPQDNTLFASKNSPNLQKAVAEFSWLLSRGYPEKATLKLVGDRYRFKERQRKAIQRAACTDESLQHRQKHYIAIN